MRGVRISGLLLSGVGVLIWVAQWAGANDHDPEGMATAMTIIDAWMFSVTGSGLLLASLLARQPSTTGHRRARVTLVLRPMAILLVAVAVAAMFVSPVLLGRPDFGARTVLIAGVGALLVACVISCALPLPRPRRKA